MLTNIINNCKNNYSILKANNIKKSYNGRDTVKDISLYVKNSEIVGLLGPNGAGKTTSFYMILGIIPVDSGSIEIDEENITNLPIYKRSLLGISYLPQDASVFRGLNVENNIKAILEIQKRNGKKLSKIEINEYTNTLLDQLQISNIRRNMAISLSGGERRRVEIARVLATEPRFILLDEPFAGVDPISILEIQKIIVFLKSRNIGILITDHNVRETLGICDRAYIINEGSVISSGRPDKIINNELVRKVYLGDKFNM
ncbi:LPS export ABC transporter ATP-binding protein [Candidatus Kinetoplastidibacterium galati]|uniref:Lipopolysaccharide export system ATP-binding protein n=1 Tax=Candidatus Kinetoplastidibacterium galati TCC219 TaxID=1208921 RepID=M1LUY1_9PROT|nr:LPS export ABC transporter ATP-binding protein [Candidatus Kinetoplastibacterium galatii]AGF49352.1 lipopolysaccharide export system ATP-binding protein [Candidatus Kinetoplastibacterium galatii TCC219]